MSRLVALIDQYKDRHGQPSDSSVARAIGVKPQTLSSWRTRGIKEPPDRGALRELARLLNVDYEAVVLRAALVDAGWIEESADRPDPLRPAFGAGSKREQWQQIASTAARPGTPAPEPDENQDPGEVDPA